MAPGLARENIDAPQNVLRNSRCSKRDAASQCRTLFTVGVITDIQYADVDDSLSVTGKRRYYRNSLSILKRAASSWGSAGVDVVIQFGDIVDGRNAVLGTSTQAVTAVLQEFAAINAPVRHVLGNHCLSNFKRQQLIRVLKMDVQMAVDPVGFYSFEPHPCWRFVVLDTCDISVLGRHRDHPNYKAACDILQSENPNADKNRNDGLVGVQRRFARFNGGLSQEQLNWLANELAISGKTGQRVVICSHIPLLPGTGPEAALVWNYGEVLQVIYCHSVVAAVVSGHTHQPHHLRDDHGIHHLVLKGAVEVSPGDEGHGFLEVKEEELVLNGYGMKKPLRMPFTGGQGP